VPAGQTAAATEITALAEVAPDRVWIGTYGNGIVEVAAGDAEHATRIRHDAETPFSLPADSVQSLYRDASGLVWAGTGQGLSQATPAQQAVRTLFGDPARRDGLTGQNVMSLLARPDGSLWAGAQGTGYDVLRNTGAVTGQLPGRRVFALAEAPAGGVLVGTDGGLYWADPQGQPKARLAVPHYAGVEDVRALSVHGAGRGAVAHPPLGARADRRQPRHGGRAGGGWPRRGGAGGWLQPDRPRHRRRGAPA
jgi:ligand-binding sensor domain-containing protein